jgi:hypothetical protein
MGDILSAIREWRGYEEEVIKAVLTSDRDSTQRQLVFSEVATVYGDVGTYFVRTLAHKDATTITHRWRDVEIRAGSTNLAGVEAGAPPERKKISTTRTNTCQIFNGRVKVSGSTQAEADKGAYGPGGSLDEVAWQTELEMKGILKDIEKQTIFGTEVTSGDERRTKGLVGDVGTWNGLIQTNRTNLNTLTGTTAIHANGINQFLRGIYANNTGYFPDTLLVSGKAALKFAAIANTNNLVITQADIKNGNVIFPAGTPVTTYLSPYGNMDVVIHPFISDSATPGNNFILAINKNLIKYADLRQMFVKPVASSGDWVAKDIIYEAALECKVEACMGILHNIDPDLSYS